MTVSEKSAILLAQQLNGAKPERNDNMAKNKTTTLIRNIGLMNGKSELQWNIERKTDTILVDPFPDGNGWCVMRDGQYVGDILPINPAMNHKVTPLKVTLVRDYVKRVLENAEVTESSVKVVADDPAMAVGQVRRML